MESAGVGFAVLGISIRTLMPNQHKLQKRLERWEGGGVGQISSKVPDLARLLLPLGVRVSLPKMDAIRGELEYETAKRKWKRLVSVIGGKGGRL